MKETVNVNAGATLHEKMVKCKIYNIAFIMSFLLDLKVLILIIPVCFPAVEMLKLLYRETKIEKNQIKKI